MRASGILLHITSLFGGSGTGTLGDVDLFIDFLKHSGQKYWQILPITPPDFVNSPYASASTFAGNPLIIDVDALAEKNLIGREELRSAKRVKGNDYEYAKANKDKLLREACANFYKQDPTNEFVSFLDENSFWLNDYALFCALKNHFGSVGWDNWPDEEARRRVPAVLERYSELLSDEIDFVKFCQYIFYSEWKVFRAKLKDADIKLIGDIPFFVAYDSADVWANPNLFQLDETRRPKFVAGVPPDYFSEDGQLWGNPQYDWTEMKKDNYSWWLKRVKHCEKLFDVLRIDHFRAFDSYYTIRYGEKTARIGSWKKGVGLSFLKQLIESCSELEIIAEDLGDIPDSVLELRDACNLPGMKVMQFAFDGDPNNGFLPDKYPERCVAYLGTHDNDTTVGWWNTLTEKEKAYTLDYLKFADDEEINWKLIETLSASAADTVIISMQDIVGSDTSSRMNTPGVLGCWKYMASKGDFSNANAKRLYAITEKTGRILEKERTNAVITQTGEKGNG